MACFRTEHTCDEAIALTANDAIALTANDMRETMMAIPLISIKPDIEAV